MIIIVNQYQQFCILVGNSAHTIDNSSLVVPEIANKQQEVILFYKNQMPSYYKQEEESLHRIIQSTVESTNKTTKVNLHIYYKCRKVRNLFITKTNHTISFTDIAATRSRVIGLKPMLDARQQSWPSV